VAVPLLRPGQTDAAVPRMKQALVQKLVALGLQSLAQNINVETKTYGPAAVTAVRALQEHEHLGVDGVVGKDTWHALGIDEPVVDDGPVFHDGKVVVAPGANLPGQHIEAMTMDFVARMAGGLGKAITITTGTNHSKFTVNGKVSDHFSGHAADIGMAANGGTDDGPVGDRIMEQALILAGLSPADAAAKAKGGGLFTFEHGVQRIQCIWKTDEGGNHHNHVHVGVRPA
jgi:Putative peptidoglycan binding domain